MGGVWEVEDAEGHRYALKSPASGMNPAAETTKRFAREANAVRMLDHPNLVAAVDVFVESGYLFLVMERVSGKTLTKELHAPFGARRALVLARQMLPGRVPFEHADPMMQMKMQVRAPPPRLDMLAKREPWCTPQLIALCEGGLAKDPEHRFPSAPVMMAALDDAFVSIDHVE